MAFVYGRCGTFTGGIPGSLNREWALRIGKGPPAVLKRSRLPTFPALDRCEPNFFLVFNRCRNGAHSTREYIDSRAEFQRRRPPQNPKKSVSTPRIKTQELQAPPRFITHSPAESLGHF